ncbi:MAG: hypothetical protein LBD64_02815 [Odoribacteraceae bacterium]|nr:hypothetical protein [Odoribacteraceae bacterium]
MIMTTTRSPTCLQETVKRDTLDADFPSRRDCQGINGVNQTANPAIPRESRPTRCESCPVHGESCPTRRESAPEPREGTTTLNTYFRAIKNC